jgi:hypothetical protein
MTGLSPNTTYYFKIKAFYQTEAEPTPIFGEFSGYGSGATNTQPGTPSAPSVTPVAGDKLQLEWGSVSDAVGYTVWCATSVDGSYQWIATTAGTSSLISGLTPNTTYYFKIKAFYQTEPNPSPIFGEFSGYGSGTTPE